MWCRRTPHRRPDSRNIKRICSCMFYPFKTKLVNLEYHEAANHRCSKSAITVDADAGDWKLIWSVTNQKVRHQYNLHPTQKSDKVHLKKLVHLRDMSVPTESHPFVGQMKTLVSYLEKSRSHVNQLIVSSLKDLKVVKAQFSVFCYCGLCRAKRGALHYVLGIRGYVWVLEWAFSPHHA